MPRTCCMDRAAEFGQDGSGRLQLLGQGQHLPQQLPVLLRHGVPLNGPDRVAAHLDAQGLQSLAQLGQTMVARIKLWHGSGRLRTESVAVSGRLCLFD